MSKFQDIYRTKSTRLSEWDYSNPWWYYVTICTKNSKNYFGEIVKGEMILNNNGKIVEENWRQIPEHFPNSQIDYSVIMPNHLHGIVIIEKEKSRDVACNVSTNPNGNCFYSNISPKAGSLSVIVRSFKSATTKQIRNSGYIEFKWQPNYYERIIRNEKELFNIRKYIEQNPLKWDLEKNKIENLELI